MEASTSSAGGEVKVEEQPEEEEEEAAPQVKRRSTGRSVTLSMLMQDNVLQSGDNVLSINYLGSRFTGDLLKDGTIRWRETQEKFMSPSSWAVHCKKLLNPDKKSGCGWSTIRYKGKKLDWYKALWIRKQRQDRDDSENQDANRVQIGTKSGLIIKKPLAYQNVQQEPPKPKEPKQTVVLNHGALGTRNNEHDMDTLVIPTPFSALDRMQPFTVSVSTNCLMLVDFHSHITKSEVVGYLAGTWDIASHNLAILQAFPCRSRLADKETARTVEEEIRKSLTQRNLTLVGWYHSHPTKPPFPSIKDCDAQLEYEIIMRGENDSTYTPCVGLICTPYGKDENPVETKYTFYWSMPPPDHRPNEYSKPMHMLYSVSQDSFLTQDLLMEMRLLSQYYRDAPDIISFSESFQPNEISYWEKLKKSLTSKLPRDLQVTTADSEVQAVDHFWEFVKGLVFPTS